VADEPQTETVETPEPKTPEAIPYPRFKEVVDERNELREALESMQEDLGVRYSDSLRAAGVTEEDLSLLISQKVLGTREQRTEAKEELESLELPKAVTEKLTALEKELLDLKKDREAEKNEKENAALAERLKTQDENIARFKAAHKDLKPGTSLWNKVCDLVDMMEAKSGKLVDPEDAYRFLTDNPELSVKEAKEALDEKKSKTAVVSSAKGGKSASDDNDRPNLRGKELERYVAEKYARRQ